MNEQEIMNLISERLKIFGISKYFIAKKMGKSKTTVAKWLNCTTFPDLPDLLQLLEIANLKIELTKIADN
ncbi:hypothetical protein [Chryseobacterium sp. MEBOG07]|uniref:hypothetical protein n=1 Tax=Chryseobacterium sp. MEBOG07 TaxID=2879939 RepID=UPI001F3EE788|nr:hypothetical protein [Chryseobacterium sp. MEBOG07]UKB81276.1 hypothetical protein LF886_09875 [Chryseobacterium sp. MEBOG07]